MFLFVALTIPSGCDSVCHYVRASTDSSQTLLNTASLEIGRILVYRPVSSRANWQASDLIGSFHIPERSSHPGLHFKFSRRDALFNAPGSCRFPFVLSRLVWEVEYGQQPYIPYVSSITFEYVLPLFIDQVHISPLSLFSL